MPAEIRHDPIYKYLRAFRNRERTFGDVNRVCRPAVPLLIHVAARERNDTAYGANKVLVGLSLLSLYNWHSPGALVDTTGRQNRV